MMNTRIETDFIGSREIPEEALYGIQSVRAAENFPDTGRRFNIHWYKAMGVVKLACYKTYSKYHSAVLHQGKEAGLNLKFIQEEVITALSEAALEVSRGNHFNHFIVPAVSGGAGTSINMNINEILANSALLKLGKLPGDNSVVDPIESANVFQSTNDVVPTALKVAVMKLLYELETAVNTNRAKLEQMETKAHHDLRIAYTQMQEAVPSSFGKLFSSYNEALSRDWWRISKCFERIKMVNLGGGAIGSGIGNPRFFIMEVVQELQRLTELPLARSENMQDVTSNLDSFVEIHAILKAHAVNLEKISSDLRLLAADITGQPLLSLPPKQVGSTVMPGKVNPVIPEFIISVAHKVYSNDLLITGLSGQGVLELNAYLPVIGDALLESLELLLAANKTMVNNMLDGIFWNKETALDRMYHSPAITTALSPFIGYNKAAVMAKKMKSEHIDVIECNRQMGFLKQEDLLEILKPDKLLKMGYTLNDLKEE